MRHRYPPLQIWLELHQKLCFELAAKPEIPKPPKFLILAGWNFSTPWEKALRWPQIALWAKQNKLEKLLPQLKDEDYESA